MAGGAIPVVGISLASRVESGALLPSCSILAPMTARGASTVHQLKMTIAGTKPPVWRRVVVPSSIDLAALHRVIQTAFGWWDCHLHEFDLDGTRYGSDDGDGWGEPPQDERRARLDRLTTAGSKFTYTYDFGDDWEHKVVVEKVEPANPKLSYPACTGGRRACPPEDCGGVWGYANLLAVLADPSDDEHASMLEWVGGAFDPDEFDPATVTARLRLATGKPGFRP